MDFAKRINLCIANDGNCIEDVIECSRMIDKEIDKRTRKANAVTYQLSPLLKHYNRHQKTNGLQYFCANTMLPESNMGKRQMK
jgi:hypothetical protein